MKKQERYIQEYWDFIHQEYKIYSKPYAFQKLYAFNIHKKNHSDNLIYEIYELNANTYIIENIHDFKKELKTQKSYKIINFEEIYNFMLFLYVKDPSPSTLLFIQKIMKDYKLDFSKCALFFKSHLSSSYFKTWWNNLPSHILKVQNHKNEIKDVFNFVENHISPKEQHDFLLSFITKRATILSNTEIKETFLKDLLIQYYQKNSIKLLQDYSNSFLFIKNYLSHTYSSDFKNQNLFFENPHIVKCIYIEIDYMELKQSYYIAKYTNQKYKHCLQSLFDFLYQQYNEFSYIHLHDGENDKNNKKFLSIFISKNTLSGPNQNEIEQLIISYLQHFQNYQSDFVFSDEKKQIFMEKWFLMHKLNTTLPKKNSLKLTHHKI